jgi:carbon monoxide dehydrogenase subunit G
VETKGEMMNLRTSRIVAAPADVLWEIMTDLPASQDRITAIQSIEILSDLQEFGIGTKWRETRTMFGKQATEVMWVTHVDPGMSYTVRAESHGAIYTTVMAVAAIGDDSSEISMDFDAESTGTMARIASATIGRLFANATRKAVARDLDDIADAAEARV